MPEAGGVYELHLALARLWLPVADDPDVGRNAGVVKHVGRQADDGFDEVILQDVAADLALAAARAAGEERGAIQHDAEARAAIHGGPHFRDEMEEEKQRAIGDARQAGTEAAIEALLGELLADDGLDLLPLHAEGRIGEHVVEEFAQQAIGGERVAEDDVGDVLPLDEHVGLADGVGLGVQLLAIHDEPGAGV